MQIGHLLHAKVRFMQIRIRVTGAGNGRNIGSGRLCRLYAWLRVFDGQTMLYGNLKLLCCQQVDVRMRLAAFYVTMTGAQAAEELA